MERKVSKQTVRINESIFDGNSEVVIECDIRLSDYCPDIGTILKTEVKPRISRKTVSGDKLMIEGTAFVTVIYTPEEGQSARCVHYSSPFSHTFALKSAPENAIVKTKAFVSYKTTRVINPRRCEVKATIGLAAKVWMPSEQQVVGDDEENGLELLKRPVTFSCLVGCGSKDFGVNEELSLGAGKPPVSNILRTDASAIVDDYKIISNKVIAKGNLYLKVLYLSDSGAENFEIMEFVLPLSQIIDVAGVEDDCVAEVRFTICECSLEPKADLEGENKMFELEAMLCAEACAYRNADLMVANDAYSTAFATEVEQKNVRLEQLCDIIKTNAMCRETIELQPEECATVIDAWAEAVPRNITAEGQVLTVEGDLNVTLLVLDQENNCRCIERTIPCSFKAETKEAYDRVRCEADFCVTSVSYSLMGMERIEIRAEVLGVISVFCSMEEQMVCDIRIFEDQPQKEDRCALTLYFAEKGERIWDIAKHYNTTVDAIMNENNITEPVLEQSIMLMVPAV